MAQLRNGMWVMYGNMPAIHVCRLDPLTSEIHYVDSMSGKTIATAVVLSTDLRQAIYEEIPLARRPTNLEYAKSKGY